MARPCRRDRGRHYPVDLVLPFYQVHGLTQFAAFKTSALGVAALAFTGA